MHVVYFTVKPKCDYAQRQTPNYLSKIVHGYTHLVAVRTSHHCFAKTVHTLGVTFFLIFLAPVSLCTALRMTTVITDDHGCTSRNVTASFCYGPCNSNATVSIIGNITTILSSCHCCKPTSLAQKSTPMICPDGSSYLHYYPVIQQCSCTRCGAATTHEISLVLHSILRKNQG